MPGACIPSRASSLIHRVIGKAADLRGATRLGLRELPGGNALFLVSSPPQPTRQRGKKSAIRPVEIAGLAAGKAVRFFYGAAEPVGYLDPGCVDDRGR